MTVRPALPAVIVAASLATIAPPALAQEVPTFEAWGHTFNVPGWHSGVPAVTLRGGNVEAKAAVTPGRAYASSLAGSVAKAGSRQATQTINVWGARLDAPND